MNMKIVQNYRKSRYASVIMNKHASTIIIKLQVQGSMDGNTKNNGNKGRDDSSAMPQWWSLTPLKFRKVHV